jgi:hypothetical protein
MKSRIANLTAAFLLAASIGFAPLVRAQDTDKSQVAAPAKSTTQVYMVVTDEAVKGDAAPAAVTAQDIQVRQGKDRVKVEKLIPAQGADAGLQLFILIDDTSDVSLGSLLSDVRAFIAAQPATTTIGVGYMSNATVNIVQNFTADKDAAAKAVRLPMGTLSAMDSPYLSLQDLIKRWPASKLRREVIMISSGIDRLRQGGGFGPRGFGGGASAINSYSNQSGDVNSASNTAQRIGVIVHTIYAQGVGFEGRNFWQANTGQSGLSQISDETGGESFALGTQNAVSFQPYLARIQTVLNSQYFLVFQASVPKKSSLQPVKFSTEVPNVEIVGAKNVWVPAPGSTDKKQ